MKKIISLILALALITVTFSAFAVGMTYEFEDVCASVNFPETYRVLTIDNLEQNDELLETLGYTAEEFDTLLDNQGAYAAAFSDDLDTEIWFQVYTTDESGDAYDMDDFTDEDRELYISSITSDTPYTYHSAEFTEGESGVFCRTEISYENRYSVSYTTIKNGAYYSVSIIKNSEGELTEAQQNDINSTYLHLAFTEVQDNPNKTSVSKKVLIILCTGVLSATAFAIAVVVLKRMGYIGKNNNIKGGKKGKPQKIKLKK